MKVKILGLGLILIAAFFVLTSFDNEPDPLVEQYCELTAYSRMLSRKVTIDVDYGEERKLFSFVDTRTKDDAGRIKKFNSVTDAINFMGHRGWTLVNAFPVTEGNQNVYHYVFKKTFKKSEVDKAETE